MWLTDRLGTGALQSLVQWEMSLKYALLKRGAAWHGAGELNLLRCLLSPQGLQAASWHESLRIADFFHFREKIVTLCG